MSEGGREEREEVSEGGREGELTLCCVVVRRRWR